MTKKVSKLTNRLALELTGKVFIIETDSRGAPTRTELSGAVVLQLVEAAIASAVLQLDAMSAKELKELKVFGESIKKV